MALFIQFGNHIDIGKSVTILSQAISQPIIDRNNAFP